MQVNTIRLPGWLNNKTVFQQNIPFVIEGKAAPSATVTLEISKDPTDGRRVSKLDTEYGVILSLETTTSSKGDFSFSVPAYKASTDAYTFTFKCFGTTVKFNDIRCGDVWVFLGNEFLCVPMKNANAPAAPLKRQTMNHLRFFTPSRNGIESNETEISYEAKKYYSDAHWIKITDTSELADVSSAVFSFAYSIADQVHYPVGVVDLSAPDTSIINWISDKALENQEAVRDYLNDLELLLDEERYNKLLRTDRKEREKNKLKDEIARGKKIFDFDLSIDKKLRALEDEEDGEEKKEEGASAIADEASVPELDFPSKSGSTLGGSAKNLDFSMFPEMRTKAEKKAEDSSFVKPKHRPSTMYRCKLNPLIGMPIRGMVFSPEKDEDLFGRYDLLLMGLLETLASVFEPHEVFDDALMPSLLFVAMHPSNVDYDYPYKVLEFNENLAAFVRRLNMPTGIISLHDLLLPDKTVTFTLGSRLAVAALGIHVTPKMPKSCPECIGVERAGNKLILSFDNLGDGLRLAEGQSELRGFAVCDQDRVFYPANARILHGVRVMVWRDDIADPTSVTYAFTPFPHDANFRNLNDLPVLPFRFDKDPAFFAPDLFWTRCDRLDFVGMEEKGGAFTELKVYRTFKGNGVIAADSLHKTEGEASLHIRYETENRLYGFEPVLSYASLMAPINIIGKKSIVLDVFNPDTRVKTLKIEGFGQTEIRQTLNWQRTVLKYQGEGDISLSSLKFTLEDPALSGEIYIDNIRFE
ncbi:MAG: hypothetical protein J5685_03460 [Clostridiales bacterium]|nr:hypothetical protein [Clostridiales bacterium]